MYNPLADVPRDRWRRIPDSVTTSAMERDLLQGGRFIYRVPGPLSPDVTAALDDRYGPEGWTVPWVYRWAQRMDDFFDPSYVMTPAFTSTSRLLATPIKVQFQL